jgi:hypothetical protein
VRIRAGFSLLVALTATAIAAQKTTSAKTAKSSKVSTKPEKTDPSRFSTPPDAATMPAVRYGALSADDCEAELEMRHIAFVTETARGVVAPVRLQSALHGVEFKTDLPPSQDATTAYQVADCRLVLALDDFAQILAAHGVVEVRHYSMYRPPPTSWPEDKPGTRHNGALALDAAKFTKQDGTALVVDKDFHGRIDAKTCGAGAAPNPATPQAIELRQILCETVDQHLFNVVLTPNYNREHHNHFHLEITAGVKWFLVH